MRTRQQGWGNAPAGQLSKLANTILGPLERQVFQRRCSVDDELARLDELAAELGTTRERVYQLEASAKQKIATALIALGFAKPGAPRATRSGPYRAIGRQGGLRGLKDGLVPLAGVRVITVVIILPLQDRPPGEMVGEFLPGPLDPEALVNAVDRFLVASD